MFGIRVKSQVRWRSGGYRTRGYARDPGYCDEEEDHDETLGLPILFYCVLVQVVLRTFRSLRKRRA